jgi:2-succinyl-6-hydroxy-2,4-cyclohexadiene-1-carboxylate synthase
VTSLLCLHGFTGSPQSWDFLGAECVRIAPALVGHAGSSASASVMSFEDEVDRLALLSCELPPLHVVGYSLGARLALGLSVRHPTRVARLTLISVHPGLSSEVSRATRRASDEAWCELLLSKGVLTFVDAWQAAPLWASQAKLPLSIRYRKQQEREQHSASGLCRSLRVTGLAAMPDYTPFLGAIQVDTAIAVGALDLKFCALGRTLAEQMPRAELHVAPSAGHDLLLERPDFIRALIR